MDKKIVIVGGSGFIGTKLTEALLLKGYSVLVLDMFPPRVVHEKLAFVSGDAMRSPIGPAAFKDAYGVVNLAGANIGKRWSASYKKLLYDSRILTTRHIVDALALIENKPSVLVSASAVGFYGDTGGRVVDESMPAGTDYLAKLCADWEREAQRAEQLGLRVVTIRTANVLGRGGLLQTLRPLFQRGFGGYFGTGKQYMPWVSVVDIVGIYVYALENPLSGPYNAGAGVTPTQKELFTAYGESINSRRLWRVPAFVARLAFGGFADSLLGGQNTVSEKIRQAGYRHQFSDLHDALLTID